MRTKGSLNNDIKSVYFEYSAYGFQSDVEILINKFVETNSIRFEEFTKIWRESDFSLIQAGRNGLREIRTFLDEAFKVVVKYLLPPYNTQIRVAALYILYGLYYTQHATPKVRIRIPLSSWSDLIELLSEIKKRGHLDVAYIGRKMLKERVFHICAYSSQLSVDELDHKNSEPGQTNQEDCTSPKRNKYIGGQSQATILSQAVDEDSLGQLNAVHEKYHSLKCQQNEIDGGSGTSPSSALDLLKPSLTNPITEIALSKKDKKQTVERKRESTIVDDDEASTRAKQLKEIKLRAFGETGDQKRPTTTIESAETSKIDEDESREYKRRGRPFQEVTLARPGPSFEPKTPTTSTPGNNASLIEEIESEQSQDDELPDIYIPEIPAEKTLPTQPNKIVAVECIATTSKRTRTTSLASILNGVDDKKKKKTPKKKKETKGKKPSTKVKKVETSSFTSAVPTEEQSRALSVQPNEFVALRPKPTDELRPIIGKVLRVINEDEIEVEHYIGGYISLWTSLALIKDGEVEGKVSMETINRSDVIMAGFKLTKHQTLSAKIRNDLREMYSIIDKKD